jgi:hypothetical protein
MWTHTKRKAGVVIGLIMVLTFPVTMVSGAGSQKKSEYGVRLTLTADEVRRSAHEGAQLVGRLQPHSRYRSPRGVEQAKEVQAPVKMTDRRDGDGDTGRQPQDKKVEKWDKR